jgi:hypothetical protein
MQCLDCTSMAQCIFGPFLSKVGVLRASHKIFLSLTGKFE